MAKTLGSHRLATLGSSREVAAKLSCSHETARKLQAGLTRPTARMRTRIREVFGIDSGDFERSAPEPERPEPDLSPPAGTIMAGVAVAPGSALAQLREQRDRLLAIVRDESASDRAKVDAERILTGTLRAIGQVEELFDRQIDQLILDAEERFKSAIAAALAETGLPPDRLRQAIAAFQARCADVEAA